jgi:general secretion pathway protein D
LFKQLIFCSNTEGLVAIIPTNFGNKLHPLVNKLILFISLAILSGCANLQNIPFYIPPPKKAIQEPKETIKSLPPLISSGTKPLRIEELIGKVDFPPDPKDDISPCIDPKTGKEKNFLLADLPNEIIPVSYTTIDGLVASLEVMGVKTVQGSVPTAQPYTVGARGKKQFLPRATNIKPAINKYTCSELPIFFKPQANQILSLPAAITSKHVGGASQFSMVNLLATDYGLQESLVAFYHPSGRKRFNHIKKSITETFDAPPVQVYIESMVLEVNESGIKELGVLYKANVPGGVNQTLQIGGASAVHPSGATIGSNPLFKMVFEKGVGAASVSQLLSAQIQALVAKGSAEILSRPSVITLNNRPAVIEVSQQKQFAMAQTTNYQSYSQTTVDFEAVTPGILLQIRPRISEAKDEVAMEIDVQVKALVTALTGYGYDSNGNVIGSKPGTSTRRVHTFALVPNKTPIIIGGLVSKQNEVTENKIPGLGDIPFLGNLFGADKASNEKKEVIVVITPHIIHDNKNIGIQTPKDTAMFDDLDMDLFRDSYRVRAEDVFDLGFVYRSKQFQKYRNYVVGRAARDEAFANTLLAKSFSGADFPGGSGLVARMLYDIVGKRGLAKPVSRDKILMTEHSGDGNFKKVTFVDKEWQKAKLKNYGLELTFSGKKGSSVQPHVALRALPLAEIKLLTEVINNYKDSSRIFIASEKDLKKIRRAIVVREIQKLNRSKLTFDLNEFSNGTKLILPVIKKTRYFLLDSDVATVYHQIKYYYDILEESLKGSFLLVENQIKKKNKINEILAEEIRKAEELRKAEQVRIQAQQMQQRQMQQRQMQQRQMQQRQMQQRQVQPGTQIAPPAQAAPPVQAAPPAQATPPQPARTPTTGR